MGHRKVKICYYIFFACIQIRSIDTSKSELIVYYLLDTGTQKDPRIIAKIVIAQIWRSGSFQGPKLTSIIYQLLQLIHEKIREQVWTFGKSKIGINNLLVNIMVTQKGPKVIVKNVIGPSEGPKMVFNLCQFLQFGANFQAWTLGRSKIGINS